MLREAACNQIKDALSAGERIITWELSKFPRKWSDAHTDQTVQPTVDVLETASWRGKQET